LARNAACLVEGDDCGAETGHSAVGGSIEVVFGVFMILGSVAIHFLMICTVSSACALRLAAF
jgi:hypothetical protein